ncbi:MAG: phage tail protein [Deltaproteobacteria bacterium]|nr:phage tail protein [Deltaproteobacteria bacterium]
MARKDPLPVFCFKVQIDINKGEKADMFFKSVSGLKYETEIIPVKEGGVNDTTWQLVGSTKWSNIVLKQGFTGSSKLLDWKAEWLGPGKKTRYSGTIIQLNTALEPVGNWKFKDGWPAKWEVSELDASKSELSIETLEIAHHGLTYTPA